MKFDWEKESHKLLFVLITTDILFFLAIGVSYYVNDDEEAREFSRYVVAMIGILVIFGIITGLFQGIAPDRSI